MSEPVIDDSAISDSSVVEPMLVETEEAAANMPDSVVSSSNTPLGNLIFESERGQGRDMRDHLEKITGLTPRTSL